MLQNSQLHPTQVAQYGIELVQIQRVHGYNPAPGAVQPLAFRQADAALDAQYLSEAARLFGIDAQHAAAAAAAQPTATPVQARVLPRPAEPMAPWQKWSLALSAILLIFALLGVGVHYGSSTLTPAPALTKAEVEAMIAAAKPQTPPQPAPAPAAGQAEDPRSPFVAAAPSGWHFTGATKGRDGANCEARGGKIVPDTSKARIPTATGFDYPNKCTADR